MLIAIHPKSPGLRFAGRKLPAGLGALLTVALAIPAQADQRTAQARGQAAATVARPIAVTGIAELDFGMVASSGPGTVAVRAGDGPATFGGSAREACTGADACAKAHAARFEVSGERSRNYRIAMPAELLVDAGPPSPQGGGLRIADLAVRTASRPGAGSKGKLDDLGRDTFAVGGTLHIPAALSPGRYSVAVPVVVAYD